MSNSHLHTCNCVKRATYFKLIDRLHHCKCISWIQMYLCTLCQVIFDLQLTYAHLHTRLATISLFSCTHRYTHYTDKESDTDTDTDTVRFAIDLNIISSTVATSNSGEQPHDKPSERRLTEPKMSNR